MSKIRARVQNGRLIVDEPTQLPEGTVLDLVVDDEGDDLSDEDRAALHDRLDASLKSIRRGEVVSAESVLERLRRRK